MNGQRVNPGFYDTDESKAEYHRMLAKWAGAGRRLPAAPEAINIVELID